MNIVIKNNCEKSQQLQSQIAEIVLDAYWDQISMLSNDKTKMLEAMTGAYRSEYFYIAYDGDTAVGVAACSPPGKRAIAINLEQMCRALGQELGQIASGIMQSEFEKPLDFGPDSAYIEFVGTAKPAQGKGVASAITRRILDTAPYKRLVLEVADTNAAAIRLYEKFGFTESKRVAEPDGEQSGFNYRIYMEHIR